MSVTTYTSGSGNWVADDTTATVECWGGGAAGFNGSAGLGGAGGGGGAYAKKVITGLTIGNSYPYSVGGPSTQTTFNVNNVVAPGATGQSGGSGGVGTTLFSGGNGGSSSGPPPSGGGGGGSSGGTAANGSGGSPGAPSTNPGGAGGTVTGGGSGGQGGGATVGTTGAAGSAPGGGGGGGGGSGTAGAGANGQVTITTSAGSFVPEDDISNIKVPRWIWEYVKRAPDYDNHDCPGIMLPLPTLRMPMQQPPLTLQFSYNLNLPTLSMPVKVVPLAKGTGISYSVNLPTLSMPMVAKVPTLSYNTVVRAPVLSMVIRGLAPVPLYNRILNLPTLSMKMRVIPFTPAFSFVLNIPTLKLLLKSHAPIPAFITPSDAPYVEPQRSGSAQVIYGSSPGPFKLNETAGPWRRGGRVHIVHTGKVKPKVCTIEAQFTLATAFPNIKAGEFEYERLDGYLTITNLDDITDSLIQDGDTFAISTTPEDTPLQPMLITIEQTPIILP